MTMQPPLPLLHRHDVFLSKVVGDGLLHGMSPGYPIRGLRIDNVSGSWLTVAAGPYKYFLPPYTLNWQSPLTPAAMLVDVSYTDGPIPALVSTLDGLPARVDTYEDLVLPSPGTPILQFAGGQLGSSCDNPIHIEDCGGSGDVNGATIRLASETTFLSAVDRTVIPFDTEFPTGAGWASTTALASGDFGAGSVPAGAAIVIPSTMPAAPGAWYTVAADAGWVAVDCKALADGQYGLSLGIVLGSVETVPSLLYERQLQNTVGLQDVSGIAIIHVSMPRQVYPLRLVPGNYLFGILEVTGDTGTSPGELIRGRATLHVDFFSS